MSRCREKIIATSDDDFRSSADFPPAFSTRARAESNDAMACGTGSPVSRSTDACREDAALLVVEKRSCWGTISFKTFKTWGGGDSVH